MEGYRCQMIWIVLVLVFGFSSVSSTALAGDYSIERDRVVTDTKQHWSGWFFPEDIVEVTDDGIIQPRYIRKDINAALNSGEFVHGKDIRGGIRAAGTNIRDASNIIDGDLDTFWEPDGDDPLRNWWVEIDLGRLVSATGIVLRFVGEGQGDPFLQFKVLISAGDRAFVGSDLMNFRLAGQTKRPNRDQRLFEYELFSNAKYAKGWTGAIVQFVRVVVTDSSGDKAELVSEDEYHKLDSDQRGAVEYFKRFSSGRERLVTREEYEAVDSSRRGSIRYYRREVPRLSEVEVWSVGDNISLGILKRGGSVSATGVSIAVDAFDGDITTKWDALVYSPVRKRGVLTIDLGATFWVDALRIISMAVGRARWAGTLEGYVMRGSDGSRAPDGTLIWEVISPKSREQNKDRALRFADESEPHRIRFLDFKNIDITGRYAGAYAASGWLNELQIYGEGYPPEITLTSGLIELGRARNLTSIKWAAKRPSGTKIEIRTRTGDELKEVKHFFNASGVEITERAWNDSPGFARGPVTIEYVPGADWSSWSQIYLKPGDPVTSPSPRKYLMIQVKFLSDDPNLAASLDWISVNFLPPVARQVVGEISPHQGVPTASLQEFVLFIRPTFLPANPGFDQILLEAPSGVKMRLLGLSLGGEDDFLSLDTEDFIPDEGGIFQDSSGDVLDVIKEGSDSLLVRLPDVIRIGGPDLIQIRFESMVFLNGTAFEASVGNSSVPDSWQRVDAGDATFLTSSRTMSVSLPVEGGIIGDVWISPNPFTPNGDGVNDYVVIGFSVLKVNASRSVEVGIYDLGGVLLRKIPRQRSSASGRYEVIWSGEDDLGRMVPPGVYLCQINLDVDSESAKDRIIHRLIHIAY